MIEEQKRLDQLNDKLDVLIRLTSVTNVLLLDIGIILSKYNGNFKDSMAVCDDHEKGVEILKKYDKSWAESVTCDKNERK